MTRGLAVETVGLSRSAFSSQLHPLLIHCQTGYDVFVRGILEHPQIDSRRQYWLVEGERREVLGFAEFRSIADDAHLLNHIAVAPHAQGRGVGTALIRAFVAQKGVRGRLELDSFESEPAVDFYRALGFEDVGRRRWSLLPSGDSEGAAGHKIRALELPAFLAMARTYGFGTLEIIYEGRSLRLGFPSDRVVRLPSETDLTEEPLLQGLVAAFPRIETFVHIGNHSAEDSMPHTGAATLGAIRMSASIDAVMAACSRRVNVPAP